MKETEKTKGTQKKPSWLEAIVKEIEEEVRSWDSGEK